MQSEQLVHNQKDTNMKTINGIASEFRFSKLYKCADLISYEGPLLSHYVSEHGDNYVFYWVDADDTYNRWLLVRTTLDALRLYVNKEATLRQLISNPEDGIVWVTDVDNDIQFHNSMMVPISNLPSEYLPTQDSYYEFENDDPLLSDDTDTYRLSVPVKDRHVFATIIERMGWEVSSIRSVISKVAVL